mmetsp:Transcript_1207/g.2890  ORF Transcript_1207/g.2890 Transcript_1207/m.2890 type:complete len:102 (+) Transcript_1207:1687-1992(+)
MPLHDIALALRSIGVTRQSIRADSFRGFLFFQKMDDIYGCECRQLSSDLLALGLEAQKGRCRFGDARSEFSFTLHDAQRKAHILLGRIGENLGGAKRKFDL